MGPGDLDALLGDPSSDQACVLAEIRRRVAIRPRDPAA
jgi:hypothetical protein